MMMNEGGAASKLETGSGWTARGNLANPMKRQGKSEIMRHKTKTMALGLLMAGLA